MPPRNTCAELQPWCRGNRDAGMSETWGARDYPVLKCVVEQVEATGQQRVHRKSIVERTGMNEFQVNMALQALSRAMPPFFDRANDSSGGIVWVEGPTERARVTTGMWPSPEGLAERIVQELMTAADVEEDEEKSSRLRKTAKWFGTTARDILVQAATKAITGQIG